MLIVPNSVEDSNCAASIADGLLHVKDARIDFRPRLPMYLIHCSMQD